MVGHRIAKLRAARGMSQQALAEAAKISMQNLSKIETGKISPREDTIQKIADGFGLTIADLYSDNPPIRKRSH